MNFFELILEFKNWNRKNVLSEQMKCSSNMEINRVWLIHYFTRFSGFPRRNSRKTENYKNLRTQKIYFIFHRQLLILILIYTYRRQFLFTLPSRFFHARFSKFNDKQINKTSLRIFLSNAILYTAFNRFKSIKQLTIILCRGMQRRALDVRYLFYICRSFVIPQYRFHT